MCHLPSATPNFWHLEAPAMTCVYKWSCVPQFSQAVQPIFFQRQRKKWFDVLVCHVCFCHLQEKFRAQSKFRNSYYHHITVCSSNKFYLWPALAACRRWLNLLLDNRSFLVQNMFKAYLNAHCASEGLLYDIDLWQILDLHLCCYLIHYTSSIGSSTFEPKNTKNTLFSPWISCGQGAIDSVLLPPPTFQSISLSLQHPHMLLPQWLCILGKASSRKLLKLFYLWPMAATSTITAVHNLPWMTFCFWSF